MLWFGFIIGVFAGGLAGVVIMALLNVGRGDGE